MRLSDLHEAKGPRLKESNKPQKKVWQFEENQGAGHANHWYQQYHKKAPQYTWPAKTGPSPEGYKEHILGEGVLGEGFEDQDEHWKRSFQRTQQNLSTKHMDVGKLLRLAKEAATITRHDPSFLEDAITVLTRVAIDIDYAMFKGVDSPKAMIEAIGRFHNKGYWPPTSQHAELHKMWLKQRFASLFSLVNTITEKMKDDSAEKLLEKAIDQQPKEAEKWREEIRTPIDLFKLLKGFGLGGGDTGSKSAAKPAKKMDDTDEMEVPQPKRGNKFVPQPNPKPQNKTPLIGSDDPY